MSIIHGLSYLGPVRLGTTIAVMRHAATAAGVNYKGVSVESDSVLVTVFVNSIGGGTTLDVNVTTATEDGKEFPIITFPTLSSASTQLILKKASFTLSKIIVRATYSGACDFSIDLRAISSGESSTKIVGATSATSQKYTATATPAILIPASLQDRSGLVLKNYGPSGTVFVGYTLAEATLGQGFPLAVGESIGLDVAGGQAIYAVTSGPTIDVRTMSAGG